MTVYTVHMPGQPAGPVQKCARCGVVLCDATGAMSLDGSPFLFWPVGGYVATAGGGTFLLSRDATEDDEIPCGFLN